MLLAVIENCSEWLARFLPVQIASHLEGDEMGLQIEGEDQHAQKDRYEADPQGKTGTAPKPQSQKLTSIDPLKLGPRTTAWKVEDILALIDGFTK